MWPMGLTLTITLIFEFWRSNVTLTFDTWPWARIFMVKFWNSCISDWEGRLILHKGGGSRSFMTMTWPFGAKIRCMDLPDSDRGDFSCRRAVDSSSYEHGHQHHHHKAVSCHKAEQCLYSGRLQAQYNHLLRSIFWSVYVVCHLSPSQSCLQMISSCISFNSDT